MTKTYKLIKENFDAFLQEKSRPKKIKKEKLLMIRDRPKINRDYLSGEKFGERQKRVEKELAVQKKWDKRYEKQNKKRSAERDLSRSRTHDINVPDEYLTPQQRRFKSRDATEKEKKETEKQQRLQKAKNTESEEKINQIIRKEKTMSQKEKEAGLLF